VLVRKVVSAALVILFICTVGSSDVNDDHKAGFVYARIRYHFPAYSRFRELPWHHDYPFGDELFTTFMERVSRVDTNREAFEIVDIDSPDLFKYPFAYMCEPGYLDLNDKDVKNLREYLDRGGFVLVDDFRGPRDLANLEFQLQKVYPDRRLVRLDVSHPIFHSLYDIESLDMDAPYGGGRVEFLALEDPKGRVQMIVNYNHDLSEVWEWIDRGEMPLNMGVTALQLGANYLIYSMTH
jgi:hypothetical protein